LAGFPGICDLWKQCEQSHTFLLSSLTAMLVSPARKLCLRIRYAYA